jgi:hypothetical protein
MGYIHIVTSLEVHDVIDLKYRGTFFKQKLFRNIPHVIYIWAFA